MGPGQKGRNRAGKGRREASVGGNWPGMSQYLKGSRGPGSQMTASTSEYPGNTDRLVVTDSSAAALSTTTPYNVICWTNRSSSHPTTSNKVSEFKKQQKYSNGYI